MPDIDPSALTQRPSISLSTPILSNKSITVAGPPLVKVPKTSQLIPARIDLEPIYAALKNAIGAEQWPVYKEATSQFLIGRLNQTEYSYRIDPILSSHNGEREHLHNQLVAALYGNVTREMPDQGLAPWVSANDKPSSGAGNKPVSGDATERRLKGDVMQLPARDRRRIKDLVQNEFDPYDSLASVFNDTQKAKPSKAPDVPASAGGINRMNWDLEIRKRFAQPLAVESGEFPDVGQIEARMLPAAYEAGLINGHSGDAAQFMSLAVETFIKETLGGLFSRTRSNGPGESGSAGFGNHASWVSTHRYARQLAREEEAALRGDLTRDKSGLLPVEAKAASERRVLGMADLRIALEMGTGGMAQFPVITKQLLYNYREGELEGWDDYSWWDGERVRTDLEQLQVGDETIHTRPIDAAPKDMGPPSDQMDVDVEMWWDGAEGQDIGALDSVLDSCLAVG